MQGKDAGGSSHFPTDLGRLIMSLPFPYTTFRDILKLRLLSKAWLKIFRTHSGGVFLPSKCTKSFIT